MILPCTGGSWAASTSTTRSSIENSLVFMLGRASSACSTVYSRGRSGAGLCAALAKSATAYIEGKEYFFAAVSGFSTVYVQFSAGRAEVYVEIHPAGLLVRRDSQVLLQNAFQAFLIHSEHFQALDYGLCQPRVVLKVGAAALYVRVFSGTRRAFDFPVPALLGVPEFRGQGPDSDAYPARLCFFGGSVHGAAIDAAGFHLGGLVAEA